MASSGSMALLRGGIAVIAASALVTMATAQTVVDPHFTVTPIVPLGSLDLPTQLRFLTPGFLFVTEKNTGRVRRIQNGIPLSTPALDLDVANDDERGLLGITLDPGFAANHFVYLYYSASLGGDGGVWIANRLSRFTWNGVSLGSEVVLATFGTLGDGQTPGPNHDGGPIQFGPDGLLYGATGDLNRNLAEQNNLAEASRSSLVGGIYRLHENGTIPASNPFMSSPTADFQRWYAYGVRNCFGIAFDPVTGYLWDTENGPDAYDEINLVGSGFNSGWTRIMGPVARDVEGTADLVQLPRSSYSDPEFSFFSTIAITGLAFLANSSFGPGYQDALLVGDFNYSQLYLFRLNANRTGFVLAGGLSDLVADDDTERNALVFGQGFGAITDVRVGPDGAIYVASLFNGTIYRLPEPSVSMMSAIGSIAIAWLHRRRQSRSAVRTSLGR